LRVNGSFAAEKGGNGRVIYFFLRFGQSPNLKKNKSHVQETSFAAEGGVIGTQVLNGPLTLPTIFKRQAILC
jgi:hypothetical protein